MIANHTADRADAIRWAQGIVSMDTLILDTETTGLDAWDEIIQISLIDLSGAVLLDTLVKPTQRIPAAATRIHGITDVMAAGGQSWAVVFDTLVRTIADRPVVIYNAAYDTRMISATCRNHNVPFSASFDARMEQFECAMLRYAAYRGEWNDYRGSYAWQRLTLACQQCRIDERAMTADAHSALGDCQRTLAILKHMAEDTDPAT